MGNSPESLSDLRQVYAERLIELAEKRKDFVIFDSDSREPTKIELFCRRFPHRSYSFGIAEQNMLTAAAGLATTGIIPFVNSYAQFVSMRALDQVRNAIAYPRLNVKIVVSHYGLDTGKDGVTHQTIEDLSIMRTIPNMVVINPADDLECRQVVDFCLNHPGPVYVRTGKSRVPRIHHVDYRFILGKPVLIREGNCPVTIIATGNMFSEVFAALSRLHSEGIEPRLINLSTIKPVDEEALLQLLDGARHVVTIEDHSIYGGLGGLLAEITARRMPLLVSMVGVNDCFAEAGLASELYDKYSLGWKAIIRTVKRAL
jgi:transketolase